MAITTYTYTRALVASGVYSGSWDIDNPNRVDSNGKRIMLAKEIEAALPGKIFTINSNDTTCDIIFDDAITVGEEITLSNAVSTHKGTAAFNPDDKTFGPKNFHIEDASKGRLDADSWYSTDNGDGTYADKVEEITYIYSGTAVVSREERKYYKDGTVAELVIWDFFENPPGKKITKLRGA